MSIHEKVQRARWDSNINTLAFQVGDRICYHTHSAFEEPDTVLDTRVQDGEHQILTEFCGWCDPGYFCRVRIIE